MFNVDKRDTNTTSIKELITIFIPLTLNMHLHARRNFSVDKYVFNKYMFNCFLIDGNFFILVCLLLTLNRFKTKTQQINLQLSIYNFEYVLRISYFFYSNIGLRTPLSSSSMFSQKESSRNITFTHSNYGKRGKTEAR